MSQALDRGEVSEPTTLFAQVGNQQIAVQLSPAPNSRAAHRPDPAPASPEESERMVQRFLAEQADQFQAEQKQARAREADNARLRSKLDELREKMKRRREHPHSPASASSSRSESPTYAGLARGFLNASKRACVSPVPAPPADAPAPSPVPAASIPAEPIAAPAAAPRPAPATFGGLRKGFLQPAAAPAPPTPAVAQPPPATGFAGLRKGFLQRRRDSK